MLSELRYRTTWYRTSQRAVEDCENPYDTNANFFGLGERLSNVDASNLMTAHILETNCTDSLDRAAQSQSWSCLQKKQRLQCSISANAGLCPAGVHRNNAR